MWAAGLSRIPLEVKVAAAAKDRNWTESYTRSELEYSNGSPRELLMRIRR